MYSYDTNDPRIGALRGDILKHSVPREVLGITGKQHRFGKNQSETIIFRRWLPFGGATTSATTINQWVVTANAHLTTEGVTPDVDTITPQDISVTLRQYSALYGYTDRTADLYEDDVPSEMKMQCGQRMGLVREMIRYGALQGCTNKYYAGGTSRTTVDQAIGLLVLRNITRGLETNRADYITRILSPSPNYSTAPVEAAWLVFHHTDCIHDIRELPGFKHVSEYGTRKPVHPRELGSVDEFRFISSPELGSVADSGASVTGTGLFSTTGTSIDVYPVIVCAQDAWGDIALRGKQSFDTTDIRPGQKDSSDPLGQRGYIGAKFYSAAFVQNDGWMAVLESGITALT